jgi:hypothetical protein
MKDYNKSKSQQPMLIKEENGQDDSQEKPDNLLFGERKRLTEADRELTPEESQEEQKMFMDSVASVVEFGDFLILEGNVEWSGKLVKENIAFIYSLDDVDGVYVNTEMLQLSEQIMDTLEKLRTYYIEWSERWGPEVSI